MKFNQNPLNFTKTAQTSSKSIKIIEQSIKINPNHAYMHQNHQRKRKSKSNPFSFLHILGLLVSHV